MKKFTSQAAQGDVLFRKIEALPSKVTPIKAENKGDSSVFIVAHSETGHHHTVENMPHVNFFSGDDPMVSFLEVGTKMKDNSFSGEAVPVYHHRADYRHEALNLDPGVYEVRRQRESLPGDQAAWQTVLD